MALLALLTRQDVLFQKRTAHENYFKIPQLWKQWDGEEPNTAARFRLKLNFKDPAVILEWKKVNIEIRTSTDLRLKEEQSIFLSSELFLIPSHLVVERNT